MVSAEPVAKTDTVADSAGATTAADDAMEGPVEHSTQNVTSGAIAIRARVVQARAWRSEAEALRSRRWVTARPAASKTPCQRKCSRARAAGIIQGADRSEGKGLMGVGCRGC